MEKIHNEEYAIKAYDAFCKSLGGKTLNGDIMPIWDNLPDILQEAWCLAATAIVDWN